MRKLTTAGFGTLPRLQNTTELLDQPIADLKALAENLNDLRAVDRLLGGTRQLWQALKPLLYTLPRGAGATLLDVATGGAHTPPQLVAYAARDGYKLRAFASDRLIEILQLTGTGRPSLPLIRHDALAIPVPDNGIDFVTCALALHHFEPEPAVHLLRELARVARRAVVLTDLRRSRLTYWGAQLLAQGPWHTMARHDGPLSALRAYTIEEVRALIQQAGLTARVEAHFPCTYTIVIRKSEGL